MEPEVLKPQKVAKSVANRSHGKTGKKRGRGPNVMGDSPSTDKKILDSVRDEITKAKEGEKLSLSKEVAMYVLSLDIIFMLF